MARVVSYSIVDVLHGLNSRRRDTHVTAISHCINGAPMAQASTGGYGPERSVSVGAAVVSDGK